MENTMTSFSEKNPQNRKFAIKLEQYLTGDLEAVLQGLCVLAGSVNKKKKLSYDYDT